MPLTPGWNNVKNNLSDSGYPPRRSPLHGLANAGLVSVVLWVLIILALLAL
jgi:hypothetical protein